VKGDFSVEVLRAGLAKAVIRLVFYRDIHVAVMKKSVAVWV
jgi:hypothetical protein